MLYMLLTLIPCIIGLIALAATIFWIWMLIDCATNKRISDSQKIIWVLVVLFTHFIGALLYFFIGRSTQPVLNVYQSYGQPQAPYNPYYQPNQQGYQVPLPYQQGYPPPPPNQGYPAAPPSPYQGYQAVPPSPYQQGYQQQQQSYYPAGSPPLQPPHGAVPPPASSLDYEQPQAMYPHEQEHE